MTEGDTLVNAVIGAVVTVVFAVLLFSPLLGGGVAGYLQKGNRAEGLRVGTYAGLIATIPAVMLMLLASIFFLGAFVAPRAAIGLFAIFFIFGFALLYTVGLSALGGYLGAYLATEADI